MCDGHLNLKEQRRLMDDCDRWAGRAERAEADVQRLRDMVERLSFALESAGVHPNLVRNLASGHAHGAQTDGSGA